MGQISTSSWTTTRQDAQLPGSQHRDLSSSSWDQQSTSAAVRKQKLHTARQCGGGTACYQHRSNQITRIRNFLQEAPNIKKVNIRIHRVSPSWKSMATRIGSSKKAEHIELKHLFVQQLVQHDLVRIIKINAANSSTAPRTSSPSMSRQTLLKHLNDAVLTTQHY